MSRESVEVVRRAYEVFDTDLDAWGTRDPVATVSVLDALVELRPQAPVERLSELGHYPQIEDPGAIAAALGRALARSAEG